MPDLPLSYRVEPDAEFADRLERVLVQRLTAPASSRPTDIGHVTAVPGSGTRPGNGWTGEDDALIDLEPMVATRRPARRRPATMIALGAAAAAVLVVALAVVVRIEDEHEPAPIATVSPTTVPVAPTTGPFVGIWLSTDRDGSSQTVEIVPTDTDEYEVVVRDEAATGACSGAPSTMVGTGRLATDDTLVIARPELTCDDGTTPVIGPPPQGELADFTFVHDPATDQLVDEFGVVWSREGADEPSTAPPASGGMWPQSSVDEVQEAQELADAGDPGYTWQVDPQLASEEGWAHLDDPGAEIVDRFLREELGWEDFVFDVFQEQRGPVNSSGPDGFHRGVTFLRCAPNATNPLYSAGADQSPGARCAPTIDELRYETVSVDLSQPDRLGQDAIWVVSGWRMIAPFTQADPQVVEADATAELEDFLQARIDGEGAGGYVPEVPLLYASTAGARYERFEIERVSEPLWPYGDMDFTVRLFAHGGETIVEQPISFGVDGYVESGGLAPRVTYSYWHSPWETTENGQPVPVPYHFLDDTVTASAAAPWLKSLHFEDALAPDDQALERVAFTDDSLQVGCQPILAATDAAALAASIQSDPDLVATAPVEVTIGGIAGLQMDLSLAPGASACPEARKGSEPNPEDRIRGTGFPLELGSRMRLYLVDVPAGSATRNLAIAVVAPDARFEAVLEATTPIIESIEFIEHDPLYRPTGDVLPEDLRDFLASEFGVAVEDASELADSLGTLDSVEDEELLERSQWSEDAEIRVYLGRRTDNTGKIPTDQWPVGAAVRVVDVTNAGVPRGNGTIADRVVIVHDAETGELMAYFESAAQGS
ncbi:MAG: hypothetical protein QOJ08_2558 [Ilumatobacteraceae bacterium]|jgi:hypothetical protein